MITAVARGPSLVIRIRLRKRAEPVRCQERPGNCAKRSWRPAPARRDQERSQSPGLAGTEESTGSITSYRHSRSLFQNRPNVLRADSGLTGTGIPIASASARAFTQRALTSTGFPARGVNGVSIHVLPGTTEIRSWSSLATGEDGYFARIFSDYRLHLLHEGIVPPPAAGTRTRAWINHNEASLV